MRIGFISDIHIDINKEWGIGGAIAEGARALNIERLYIAGDVSNSATLSLSFVKAMKERFGIDTYLIPGNHDYFSFDGSFGRMRHTFLNSFPHVIDGVGIMGDSGWYDYTWLPRYQNFLDAAKGRAGGYGTKWPDHRFINYPNVRGDTARWLSKVCLNNLHRQHDILNSHNIQQTIIITHMVPHEDFLVKDEGYSQTNCYFGGENLQKFITNAKPNLSVFGHTHFVYDRTIDETQFICSPIGYMSYEHSSIIDPLEFAIKHIVVYDTKERGIVK